MRFIIVGVVYKRALWRRPWMRLLAEISLLDTGCLQEQLHSLQLIGLLFNLNLILQTEILMILMFSLHNKLSRSPQTSQIRVIVAT